MPNKDRSRTIEHALDVLETLQAGGGLGVSEIARRLGLSKTAAHRVLATLEDRQYARKDPATQKYTLTLKLWQLGAPAMRHADLPVLAHEILVALVRETGETAYVSILDGTDVVWIAKVEGPEPLRVYVEVGGRLPAYYTASGKALLAYAPDAVRHALARTRFSKLTRRTIGDPADLERELAQIRASRVSFNQGERRADIGAVAAPVFDGLGRAVAALGISGPLTRLGEARQPRLAAIVRRAARALSRRLDAGAPPAGVRRQITRSARAGGRTDAGPGAGAPRPASTRRSRTHASQVPGSRPA